MGLVEAILEGSSLVKEVVDLGRQEGEARGRQDGRAEGRTEGRTEGRAHEAQRLLRSVLRQKFPGLDQMPEIEAISNIEILEALLLNDVLPGGERDSVKAAILGAAGS